MLRPLHTVIRNLTNRTLIFETEPRIYIYGHGEQELDFDPFTRFQLNAPALETLLISVRKGEAQIVYKIDPKYATAGAGNDFVRLSMNAERMLGTLQAAPKAEKKPEVDAGLRKVPFGKTFEEVSAESVSSAQVSGTSNKTVSMISDKLDPAVQSKTVVVSKEAADIVDTSVDLSKQPEATPAPETKKKRGKKAVTTL